MVPTPLVSVVIITYNHEKYIAQTIDCALAQQTEYDFEIVIGEDCSTDKTREIVYRYLREYPDKIRVVTSDHNVGLMDNYFRSVMASQGKYIATCGGDDYWHHKGKIQNQVRFLEENPDYGMVHCDEDVLFEDTKQVIKNYNLKSRSIYDNSSLNTLELLFSGKYRIVASSAVFRKIFFKQHFDIKALKEHQIVIEDMPLWLILAAHSKIYYLPDSYVTRRVVRGSVTRQGFDRKIELWNSVYRCYLYYYGIYGQELNSKSIDIRTIHHLLNRLMLKSSLEECRIDLIRYYYHNIRKLAGQSYLRVIDDIVYYLTYVPFGIWIYKYLVSIYNPVYERITGIPRKKL